MIVTLNQHPLLKQWYRLMRKTDALPAHSEQTVLITDLGLWGDSLKAHLQKHGLLKEQPVEDQTAVRVMKIRNEPHVSAPCLIIAEDEKDSLLDYFEDWTGKLYIEFGTMTRAEIDALPEFDGF